MTRNKKNIFSLKKDKRYVRPNGLHVRSNLVPGLTYDRLIGKGYLQACEFILKLLYCEFQKYKVMAMSAVGGHSKKHVKLISA